MTETTPLKKEFQYYLDHQAELVEKHRGRVVVIKGEKVIGVYDSELEAIEKTTPTEPLGTFLLQRCEPGPEGHTATFHSRVSFA